MSAGPRAQSPAAAEIASDGDNSSSSNTPNNPPTAVEAAPPSVTSTPTMQAPLPPPQMPGIHSLPTRPTVTIPAAPDMASLRAAALKSARAAKTNAASGPGPGSRSANTPYANSNANVNVNVNAKAGSARRKGKGKQQQQQQHPPAPARTRPPRPKDEEREDGEISESEDSGPVEIVTRQSVPRGLRHQHQRPFPLPPLQSQPPPPPASARPPSPPGPPPPLPPSPSTPVTPLTPSIVRSTVVTLSDRDTGTVTWAAVPTNNPANGDDAQFTSMVRDLLAQGVEPHECVSQGAPEHVVAQVCKEIVQRARWATYRQPPDDDSAANSVVGDVPSNVPSRARSPSSRSSSPDIKVAVAMGRTSSESSTEEALVERMSPPPSLVPKIVSSWTPTTATGPSFANRAPQLPPQPVASSSSSGAIHLDSYRPLSRPASTDPHPPSAVTRFPPRGRRNRDRDQDRTSKIQPVETLNYDDDASPAPTPPAATVPAPIPPVPSTSVPTSVPTPLPAPVPVVPIRAMPVPDISVPTSTAPTPAPDVAAARRRALESLRKRKAGTATPNLSVSTPPVSTPPPAAPTPEAVPSRSVIEEAAQLEREVIAGSTAEVPMDIDDEMEDGEIADEPPARPASPPSRSSLPPRAPSLPPTTQPSLRGGVKRPHAEEFMDNNARPLTARPAPRKRRAFGGALNRSLLHFPLDRDSDSESDDEPTPPPFEAPIITIPQPFDTAALLAEKEEKIRRLKEQIASRLAAQKTTLASGTSTPCVAARVEAATKAADQVGVEGVASDVVEAAVLAAVDEQQASTHAKKPDDDDVDMEVAHDAAGPQSRAPSPDESLYSEPEPPVSTSNFRPYAPMLPRYPQLTAAVNAAVPDLTITHPPANDERDSASDSAIDWNLVSSIILTHRLQKDPMALWCRSEAGGGRCADSTCEDFHLDRVEPTDDDLVVYVQELLDLHHADSNDSKKDKDGSQPLDASEIAAALTAAKSELGGKRKTRSSAMTSTETPEGLTALIALTVRKLQAR